MRNPARIEEMLRELGETWNRHPDLRLGQLLYSISRTGADVGDIFYIEDDILLDKVREFNNKTGSDPGDVK